MRACTDQLAHLEKVVNLLGQAAAARHHPAHAAEPQLLAQMAKHGLLTQSADMH